MRESHRIVLASSSYDKLEEFRSLFKVFPEIELIPASDILFNAHKLGLVEQFDTYSENSTAKARKVNQGCHLPALADDSGLEVDALDGMPGVRTARYAIPKAGQSQDEAGIEKLLGALKGRPMDARKAHFVCHLTLVMEGVLIEATGALEGAITEAPRGTLGFGYDPVFMPKDQNRTLAEMTESEKNAISHRARAFNNLVAQIHARGILFAKP